MNAAAKVIHNSNFFSGQFSRIRLSRALVFHLILLTCVLFSALAVIYTSNMYRLAFSELQFSKQKANDLQLQWGKLLLEQASLATPARVQQLATEKLKMVLPTDKQVLIVSIR